MSTTVERIANAVLYEGYILYPYRASTVKNQQRWNFGAVYPEAYSLVTTGTEPWVMQTQCLFSPDGPDASLDVKLRFLHLVKREICELLEPSGEWEDQATSNCRVVPVLEIDGQLFHTWQEAVEREVIIAGLNLHALEEKPMEYEIAFAESQSNEPLRKQSGEVVAFLRRTSYALNGKCELMAERMGSDLLRLTIRTLNLTPMASVRWEDREDALLRAFVSTHTILNLHEGQFISLFEPPDELAEAVSSCQNIGTYPVLVGDEGERNCMLSSPIILYDYPQIAPESAGDLFDGTEIDEILTLRIMTLTDEEKREMRSVDERARQILERTERLAAEEMMALHGVLRNPSRRGEEQ